MSGLDCNSTCTSTYRVLVLVFPDADVPDAGPPVLAVSQCGSTETGQTGGATESHLHHQGTHTHIYIIYSTFGRSTQIVYLVNVAVIQCRNTQKSSIHNCS